jgi:hypothetical protein
MGDRMTAERMGFGLGIRIGRYGWWWRRRGFQTHRNLWSRRRCGEFGNGRRGGLRLRRIPVSLCRLEASDRFTGQGAVRPDPDCHPPQASRAQNCSRDRRGLFRNGRRRCRRSRVLLRRHRRSGCGLHRRWSWLRRRGGCSMGWESRSLTQRSDHRNRCWNWSGSGTCRRVSGRSRYRKRGRHIFCRLRFRLCRIRGIGRNRIGRGGSNGRCQRSCLWTDRS